MKTAKIVGHTYSDYSKVALWHRQSATLPLEKSLFMTAKCRFAYARVSLGENEWRVRRNGRTLHVNKGRYKNLLLDCFQSSFLLF